MFAAANYAWVNRQSMTYLARNVFEKLFKKSARDLDMHLVYDVVRNNRLEKIFEDNITEIKFIFLSNCINFLVPQCR
jgi:tRNA-splicing ligase RtcB